MRLSHYLLMVATIGWMAVALVWGVNRFVVDISFAPIELVYLGAFAVSALIGGLVFNEASALAEQAEYGDLRFPNPMNLVHSLRHSARQRQEDREEKRAVKTKRRTARKQGLNLRW